MRIISGTKRGMKLVEFEGMDIRPTTDRVRESVFNLIQGYVRGAVVLDLFAGSGALSFEALSRGAQKAVCVDSDRRSVAVISENMQRLRFCECVEMITDSAQNYIDGTDKKFDIIFLDPPYNKGYIAPVVLGICKKGLLNEGGIIVLESDGTDEHGEMDGLSIIKQRKYGRTFVTIYQRGDMI